MNSNQMREETGHMIKNLVEGDIIIVTGRGFPYVLGRIFQRTKRWHHVMLYIGKGKVLEAVPRAGCIISMLNVSKKLHRAVKVLRNSRLPVKVRKRIVRRAIKLFYHKRFSLMQFIKIFFVRDLGLKVLFRNLFSPKPGQVYDTKAVICSNFIAMAYYFENCLVSKEFRPEYIVPKDFEKAERFDVVLEQTYQKGL